MATKTRAELKAYFETDDAPTEAQFGEMLDGVPNLEDDGILLGGESGITAHAGGGQANAYELTKYFNNVATVANPGDSVMLPLIVAGRTLFIGNTSANAIDVFPQVGEQIEGLAVNAALSMAGGEGGIWGTDGVKWGYFKSA